MHRDGKALSAFDARESLGILIAGLFLLPAASAADPEHWRQQGREAIARAQSLARNQRARNVILFVGDGMGISTVTAARILEGQLRGEPGEENLLSFSVAASDPDVPSNTVTYFGL